MSKEKNFKTIPNEPKVTILRYEPKYATICSIGKEEFTGTILIEFHPDLLLLEFMSFEEWLRSLIKREMTIEELCRLVFDELLAALGDIPLVVTVTAKTTVHAPVRATVSNRKEHYYD